MNAQYITALPGRTTLENATTTLRHIFLLEGSYYEVEANCQDQIESLVPIGVKKLEPRGVILTGELKNHLEGYFLE
jgi:hypothetical protein